MFSVIMPYYRNSSVVHRSINSVLSQEYPHFELIIVDDGSNDEISAIVSRFNDNRIRLFHQSNSGVSAARNTGIANAKFDWICFLDSDDEWKPNHLTELKYMIDHYSGSQLYVTSHLKKGNSLEYSNNLIPKDVGQYWVIKDFILVSANRPGIIHTNSVCISKKQINEVGGFETGVQKGEDTDLWYRCSLFSDVIVSRAVTTIYNRENSFLTKKKSFNYDWVFLKRESELINNCSIPENKRYSVKLFCQKYRLSMCKHYIADSNKTMAGQVLKSLKSDICKELYVEYYMITLFNLLPANFGASLLTKIYDRKRKQY